MNKVLIPVVNAFQYLIVFIQTNAIFQYIELGIAILTSIVMLAYRIYHWVKEAKADGKITADEIKEGVEIIKDGVDELVDEIEQLEKVSEKEKDKDGN